MHFGDGYAKIYTPKFRNFGANWAGKILEDTHKKHITISRL